MIKFEKDEFIMFFSNGDEAVVWLEKEFKEGGRFEDLLSECEDTFADWLNYNYSAFEILLGDYNYDELHKEWAEDLAYDIEHNCIDYFYNLEEID